MSIHAAQDPPGMVVDALMSIRKFNQNGIAISAVLDGEEVHAAVVGHNECAAAAVVEGEQAFALLEDRGEFAGVDGAGAQARGGLGGGHVGFLVGGGRQASVAGAMGATAGRTLRARQGKSGWPSKTYRRGPWAFLIPGFAASTATMNALTSARLYMA